MSELLSTAARFSGRVADYARYRPSYPAEAIDAILAGMGEPTSLTVVDIGAGTGISARLFAGRGARVIGIEPNPEMRSAARAAGLDARDGTAQSTGLDDESADVATAFQAFHWFATPHAAAELFRVVRRGGRVALVWNVRDQREAFTKAYGRIADVDSRAAQRAGQTAGDPQIGPLLEAAGFAGVRALEFRYAQRLSLEALLGRARSASYVPREGSEYDAIVRDLTALHDAFADDGGAVELVYRTAVHLAERP